MIALSLHVKSLTSFQRGLQSSITSGNKPVNLKETPVVAVLPDQRRSAHPPAGHVYELNLIVLATGFNAIIDGSYARTRIAGRAAPVSYLDVCAAGLSESVHGEEPAGPVAIFRRRWRVGLSFITMAIESRRRKGGRRGVVGAGLERGGGGAGGWGCGGGEAGGGDEVAGLL